MGFYLNSEPNKTDSYLYLGYLIISLVVFGILFLVNSEEIYKVLLGYTLLTQMTIYGVFYRSLRYLKFNLYWLLIAFLHAVAYYFLKDDPYLQSDKIDVTIDLLFTGAFVLLFNLLRLVTVLIMRSEFETNFAYGSSLFDERKLNVGEWIAFVVYFSCFLVFQILT
ncbi:MAG: hypothetical protein MK078_15320 [Crocinitomicaceae bacterium]|nr:hypothetical protein [Crocinitomicaceae bacterium]